MFSRYKSLSDLVFTEYEVQELIKAKEYFDSKGVRFGTHLVVHIRRLKVHNVSFSSLTERLEKILLLGKDSSSKKSMLYRYGWAGFKKFKEKNKNCSQTSAELLEKFGSEYAKVLSEKGASLENYIKRHGTEIGNVKWQEYLNKRAATYKQKHIDGHEFPKYNLDYYINLHGKDKGSIIYSKKIEAQRYKVSLQYYIDKYGNEEGTRLCKLNKAHTSKEAFIAKYGVTDGTLRFLEYSNKQSGTLEEKYKRWDGDQWEIRYNSRFKGTLACFQKKYGEEEGLRLHTERTTRLLESNSTQRSRSKISNEFFDYVKIFVPNIVHYGSNEMLIKLTKEQRAIYNRFTIRTDLIYGTKIVEFNGDTYHANPLFYKDTDCPNPYLKELTAAEIWETDNNRYKIFKDMGFEYLIVWASEYSANKLAAVTKCMEFLNA